ncbi:uncharacterized protein HMPREF1541_02147 [Cyphellophora europaea CBS 101466]|uniref:Core domain-containing protein n=1 Tax=Cyphellophora europaea (strain CBS 101466) TaxID=1220924 RepID=W2S4W7_CYPE1|nr:uncharacterized protein HMPREF1541_02147 [Cyphellophora europaea CBS 101466]ETN42989.1 hypothetical protein HMPREF1541_02147 [Cyphellophora europaea CBS 101466]
MRRHAHDPAAFFRGARCFSSPSSSVTPRPAHYATVRKLPTLVPNTKRPLSTSTPRPATAAVLNPRVDDEGNNMTITISENAAKRLKQITSTPQKRNTLAKSQVAPDSHLRVTVTSGGCHGFQYMMSLEPADKIDPAEDTVFAVDVGGDMGEAGKAEVVMDEPSLELLTGSTVDFVTELIGSQFKIVGNPKASSSCGCGTSFDIQ